MKSKHFMIIAIGLIALQGAQAEDLTIRKIAVAGTETTDPALIAGAFLEVAEGDTLPRERLVEVADLVRNRLLSLGYFSSAEVTLVPSRTQPGMANLVAEVTEGFTGRFGGGPIFGWAAIGNLEGRGKDAALGLGWNLQTLGWTDRFPGWKGGSWTASGGNHPRSWTDGGGSRHEDHAVGASGAVTQEWGWGWSGTLTARTEEVFDSGYQNPRHRPEAVALLSYRRVAPGFSPASGLSGWGEIALTGPTGALREAGDLRTYVPLGAGFKVAVRIAGAMRQGPWDEREAGRLSGLDGVRKGWDATDLVRTQAWTSMELRWEAPSVDLFGFTTLTFEPALVGDAGIGWSDTDNAKAWAAGTAVRIFVNAPVDLPLRWEETLDQKGRLTTFVGVQAPY